MNQASRIPNSPGYKHDAQDIEIVFKKKEANFINDSIVIQLVQPLQNKFNIDFIKIDYKMIWGFRYRDHYNNIMTIFRELRQIKIVWNRRLHKWVIKLIYDRNPIKLPSNYKNVMAIDIGLNNICALTFRYGLNSYLINGRPLKAFNRNANYEIDQIQSSVMKQISSSHLYCETDEIRIIRVKRDYFINNYFHQASKCCVDIALQMQCRVIVIGDISGIKQGNKNKSFVQIPLLRFVDLIKFKAELSGMTVVILNEAYTSITSAIDLEEVMYGQGRAIRRICRGSFISNHGILINSDINGSLNILRKFLDIVYAKRISAHKKGTIVDLSGSIPEMIPIIRDKGFVVDPIKLQIFNKNI